MPSNANPTAPTDLSPSFSYARPWNIWRRACAAAAVRRMVVARHRGDGYAHADYYAAVSLAHIFGAIDSADPLRFGYLNREVRLPAYPAPR